MTSSPEVSSGGGMPDVALPLALGQPCTGNDVCGSGNCVDGICCNSPCAGACQACDVPGSAGMCAPVAKGEDPDDDCARDPVNTCKLDGTCDGQGACARYAAGTACKPGSCMAGVENAAATCNGQGQCVDGATQPCRSGVCAGTSCGNACSADSQCQPGFFCDAGTCRTKLAVAAACMTNAQCASGHCVDRVCCASECAQGCYACNLMGSVGSCTAIPSGQDPARECVAEPITTCGRAGGCNGRGGCRLHPAGTTCVAGACGNAMETSAQLCNGLGMCQTATTKSCGNFVCKGAVCATVCAANTDCNPGSTCSNGVCVVTKIASLRVNDTAHADGWSMQRNFQIGPTGAHPWSDWPASYVAAMDAGANILLGAEWIRVAAESKTYDQGPQAAVTLAVQADVYLIVDDRWGEQPTWLSGWTKSNWMLTVWESATRSFPFTIWAKTAQTGTVTIPPIDQINGYNSFIVVK
ncbi:MAG TPA: hypothetical protein VGG33_05210 [Polyangia bacterium]